MTCMRYFAKRFSYIARQVEKMKRPKLSHHNTNRKMSRLVAEHGIVHHDLMLINDFFKYYLGFNLIMFFAIGVIVIFVSLLDVNLGFVKLVIAQLQINNQLIICTLNFLA